MHALILAAFVVATCSSFANIKADMLIIGDVRSLLLYNQYQQRVSLQDKAGFPPFAPFHIVNANDHLGDGFTRCMKVTLDGKLFYIEQDSSGALRGETGFLRTFRNVLLIGDTVEVLHDRRMLLAEPEQRGRQYLDRGSRLERIFTHQNRTYVKLLGAGARFGWMDLSQSASARDWKIATEAGMSVASQIEKVFPAVEATLKDANSKLAQLFDVLGKEASLSRKAPQWRMQQAGQTIVCTLESEFPHDAFAESAKQFGKKLEGVLLGTVLRVYVAAGNIAIRQPDEK